MLVIVLCYCLTASSQVWCYVCKDLKIGVMYMYATSLKLFNCFGGIPF